MSATVEDMKLFCKVFTEFWSNFSDCMARLGANMKEHASEVELYIILATLENFECLNQNTKCHRLKRSRFSVLWQW